MNKTSFGLIKKVALIVALVEIIAFGLIGYFNLSKYTTSVEESTKDRISLINEMLTNEEIPISSISRFPYMTNMVGHKFLEGLVIGSNGFIIVSSNPKYLGKSIESIPLFNSEWLFETPGELFIKKNNTLTTIAYLQNKEGLSPLYRTVTIFDTSKLEQNKQEILIYIIIASVSLIILSTLAIIFFAQFFIGKRIDTSLETLKKAQEGDLSVSIPITEHDEIGSLQQGINTMIQQVGNLLVRYKKSLHETEISKRLLRDIIDTVPVRIFWKDRKGKYLGANKLFLQDAQLENETQIKGKTDWDMPWKSNAQSYIDDDNKVMDKGIPQLLFEEFLPLDNDEVKILLTSKAPLFDQDTNEVYGILGVFNDITDHKKKEEQLKKQEKLIEDQSKNAAMGEMIGNIAHQWRQPLSVISSGATGMILQKQFGSLSDEQFEKTCNTINENAQYLSKTIDDFKNFIKNERTLKVFKLKETIESFLNLVEPSFKRHNIHLILKLDDSIKLKGYPNELTQCFMNIFNNAKDALKNSPHPKKLIFIETKVQDNNIIINFRDNAGGIPENVLPRIFEPYFTTKHQAQGTGLGLSMTYNLITKGMDGSIIAKNVHFSYEEEFYLGAEFTITLPLEKT